MRPKKLLSTQQMCQCALCGSQWGACKPTKAAPEIEVPVMTETAARVLALASSLARSRGHELVDVVHLKVAIACEIGTEDEKQLALSDLDSQTGLDR